MEFYTTRSKEDMALVASETARRLEAYALELREASEGIGASDGLRGAVVAFEDAALSLPFEADAMFELAGRDVTAERTSAIACVVGIAYCMGRYAEGGAASSTFGEFQARAVSRVLLEAAKTIDETGNRAIMLG